MKISIITGTWLRPALFEYFCDYYKRLKEIYPFDLVIACSDNQSWMMAKNHGHRAIMIPNMPLYKKMNGPAKLTKLSDYVIALGDDDFITPKALLFYVKLFEQRKADYIYPLDWYFYDTRTGQGLYWGGYTKSWNKGVGCGAGRAFSKNLMARFNYEPWQAGYDRVLDTGMEMKLKKIPHTRHGFYLKAEGIFCVDIKTSRNMTPFAHWDNTTPLDGEKMLIEFMPEERERILTLSQSCAASPGKLVS